MKILLTGCNGQVGWELQRRGTDEGFEIFAFDHDRLDITKPLALREAIYDIHPLLVINAAAYTAVDRAEAEPELAFSVNRDAPAYLASSCAEAGISLIHLSTDYVFDGSKRGPYLETDPVSPLGIYGKSKAEGEASVRSILKKHIIIRTAWLYGIHGNNFVKTMLRLGQEKETLSVVSDQYGCPTYAGDLADAILTIANCLREGRRIAWGTYHYCGQGKTTWHGFAEKIFDLASQHRSLMIKKVVPVPTTKYPTPAKRPANSVLDCSLIRKTFGIRPKPWLDSLPRVVEAIVEADRVRSS